MRGLPTCDLPTLRCLLVGLIALLLLLSVGLTLPYIRNRPRYTHTSLAFPEPCQSLFPTTTIVSSFSPSDGSSDASGSRFSAERVRTFDATKHSGAAVAQDSRPPPAVPDGCQQWAVVTTIFEPSEASRRASRLGGWCLVIVADTKSPEAYDVQWWFNAGAWASRVVYLRPDDQRSLDSAFVDAMPWNSFGRKNIGYLYAIQQGARLIWDFDDDNELIFFGPGRETLRDGPVLDNWLPSDGEGAAPYPVREVELQKSPAAPAGGASVFNPYPGLGGPEGSWPRGFPLSHIQSTSTFRFNAQISTIPSHRIGVLQSLAHHQPDVDAIYRLTRKTPFDFARQPTVRPLLVPLNSWTPYNAQATLHNYPAFWALYLPITVPGRVSDIWRSYIAQRLFRDVHLRLGFFSRPLVVQDRNSHDYLRDFDAEDRLYRQTEALIAFLDGWSSTAPSLPARIEELWIALYERNFLDLRDVELVQLWLGALDKAGYQFPTFDDARNAADARARGQGRLLGTSGAPHPPRAPSPQNLPEKPPSNDVSCPEAAKLRLWSSDLHDGVRMDVSTIVSELGGAVSMVGQKGTVSPHPELMAPFMGPRLNYVDVKAGWLSPAVQRYISHSTPLDDQLMEDNFAFYSQLPAFVSHNAVACNFPPGMCELFLALNRSVIFAAAHRYNLGRCTQYEWDLLDRRLSNMAAHRNPQHFIAAQNEYDARYMTYYTGIKPRVVELSSHTYLRRLLWAGNRAEVLYFHRRKEKHFANAARMGLHTLDSLYGHWSFKQLLQHPALVFVPYSVSSFKLTEFYALGLPMLIPSLRFFNEVDSLGPDRTSTSPPYCSSPGLDKRSRHPGALDPYSPNTEFAEDPEAEIYWLQFSDFYVWPHISYFDNSTHLEQILGSVIADAKNIHKRMMYTNALRSRQSKKGWCQAAKVATSHPPGRIPRSMAEGLADYDKCTN